MGIPVEAAHSGMFTAEQCKDAIGLISNGKVVLDLNSLRHNTHSNHKKRSKRKKSTKQTQRFDKAA
jgi:hypothetical protein